MNTVIVKLDDGFANLRQIGDVVLVNKRPINDVKELEVMAFLSDCQTTADVWMCLKTAEDERFTVESI